MKLRFDKQWLRQRIEDDPDCEIGAGAEIITGTDLMALHDGRYTEFLLAVMERLKAYYNDKEIIQWMTLPHPQLDGQAPISEMKMEGGLDRINTILDRLDADAYI